MAFKNYEKNEKKATYEVLERFGKFGSGSKMTKELRLVSWNGNDPKYDLRGWGIDDDGNETMSKGITLSADELQQLFNILSEMNESN